MVRTGKRESSISTTYFAIVPMKLSLVLSILLLIFAGGVVGEEISFDCSGVIANEDGTTAYTFNKLNFDLERKWESSLY